VTDTNFYRAGWERRIKVERIVKAARSKAPKEEISGLKQLYPEPKRLLESRDEQLIHLYTDPPANRQSNHGCRMSKIHIHDNRKMFEVFPG
jgi:hypothetical protein